MMTRNPKRKRVLGEHFKADGKPKKRFDTKGEAQEWVQTRGTLAKVYPCSFCGGYHLASPRGCQR